MENKYFFYECEIKSENIEEARKEIKEIVNKYNGYFSIDFSFLRNNNYIFNITLNTNYEKKNEFEKELKETKNTEQITINKMIYFKNQEEYEKFLLGNLNKIQKTLKTF